MVSELINANPVVYEKKERRVRNSVPPADVDEYAAETIDQLEIFDHLRDIKDPEHPYSLEELKVITEDAIEVNDSNSYVRVTFTPTVEHCSMATIIGLCLRVKLMRSLPSRFKVMIRFIDALRYASVVNPTLECVISTIQKKDGQIKSLQIDIRIAPGSHATEDAVNKQLSDKERVAAALENPNLVEMVDECLAPSFSC